MFDRFTWGFGRSLDDLQKKKITIIQADPLPLNGTYSDKFRSLVQQKWEKRNIEFVLSSRLDLDKIAPDANGNVYTEKGQPIRADLVVSLRDSI